MARLRRPRCQFLGCARTANGLPEIPTGAAGSKRQADAEITKSHPLISAVDNTTVRSTRAFSSRRSQISFVDSQSARLQGLAKRQQARLIGRRREVTAPGIQAAGENLRGNGPCSTRIHCLSGRMAGALGQRPWDVKLLRHRATSSEPGWPIITLSVVDDEVNQGV